MAEARRAEDRGDAGPETSARLDLPSLLRDFDPLRSDAKLKDHRMLSGGLVVGLERGGIERAARSQRLGFSTLLVLQPANLRSESHKWHESSERVASAHVKACCACVAAC